MTIAANKQNFSLAIKKTFGQTMVASQFLEFKAFWTNAFLVTAV